MVAPLVVDDRQHDRLLDLFHHLAAKLLLTVAEGLGRLIDEKVGYVLRRVGPVELGDVDLGGIELLDLALEVRHKGHIVCEHDHLAIRAQLHESRRYQPPTYVVE